MRRKSKSLFYFLAVALVIVAIPVISYAQSDSLQATNVEMDEDLYLEETENISSDYETSIQSTISGCTGSLNSRKVKVEPYDEKKLCEFVYDGKAVMYFWVDTKLIYPPKEQINDYKIQLSLRDKESDKAVEKVNIGHNWFGWLYFPYGKEKLEKGKTYTVYLWNMSGKRFKAKYIGHGYSGGYATKAKVNKGKLIHVKAGKPKFYTLKTSNKKKLALVKSVKSSNSSIANGYSCGHQLKVFGKKAGTCTLTVTLMSGKKFKTKVKVKNGTPMLRWTSYQDNRGKTFKNKVLYNNGKVKWKSSNSKVAKVNSKGKVTLINVGKCTITAKVAGKTLKCKVKVWRYDPNFGAYLYDYNTRNNYFVVKIKNKGKKTLTITSGIKVRDIDYKSFDRKIRLKKKVKIKSGKTKKVRFYVKGKPTWYNASDFTLYYKFNYDGKTYEGHVWDEDSVFEKKKNSWYSTYWDEEWYESWY